jgi:hypothetical protein
MTDIYAWAKRHGVPYPAVQELLALFGTVQRDVTAANGLSEAAVQTNLRLEASRKGIRLWRNNVGVAHDPEACTYVRYGLANESTQMNRVIKSSDLIGIAPIVITEAMIGNVIGQFISREVKAANWRYSGTEREVAQLNWIKLVTSLGGNACFANSEGTL